MIYGRAYHPQTQGSMESANRTFKSWLRSLQIHKGVNTWVSLLPELALVLNTCTSVALPGKTTPFEVWFGQKPHWINYQLEDNESSPQPESIDNHLDIEDDDELVLTEIERRVHENNLRIHA